MPRRSFEFAAGSCVETPCVVLASFMGNLLYTPPSLSQEGWLLLGQLELTDVIEKDFGDVPLSALCAPAAQGGSGPRLIMSARSMTRGCGVGTKRGVDMDAPGGRKAITPQKLAARLAVDRPLAVIALADEVCMTSGAKRLTKSTERTTAMFKELMSLPELDDGRAVFVFGVAVAGHTPEHLPAMAAALVAQGARGVVIGGANLGEAPERLSDAVQRVRAAIGPTRPILLQGVDCMADLLRALRDGADMLSSNLPLLVSQLGHALVLPALAIQSSKRARTESGGSAEDLSGGVQRGKYGPAINLWEERHRKDQTPIDPACRCHCCLHHTRAYLHHLLRAKELLAEVLIYQHNQHQLLRLLDAARAWPDSDYEGWLEALG